MSLLWMEYEADFQNLADDAFHRACEADPACFSRLTPRVSAIRKKHPDSKIAVGGKAFASTHDLWKQWPIDLYTPDARQLLTLADKLC